MKPAGRNGDGHFSLVPFKRPPIFVGPVQPAGKKPAPQRCKAFVNGTNPGEESTGQKVRRNEASLEIDTRIFTQEAIEGIAGDWLIGLVVRELIHDRISNKRC